MKFEMVEKSKEMYVRTICVDAWIGFVFRFQNEAEMMEQFVFCFCYVLFSEFSNTGFGFNFFRVPGKADGRMSNGSLRFLFFFSV